MDRHHDPNVGSDYFEKVGLRYEQGFGHNEGQIRFVQDCLARLSELSVERASQSSSSSSSSASLSTRLSVLDVGVGTGKPTAAMVVAAGHQVHGIDSSPAMTDIARRQVPQGTYEAVNMLEYMPSKAFDAAFAIFSLFQFTSEEMERVAARWGAWVRPGGFLFVGTMAAEEFGPGVFTPEKESKATAGFIVQKFLGDRNRQLLYTREGWSELLARGGYELVSETIAPFQPPPELDSDWEPHYYMIARKVAAVSD